jgi:hypothetical protein
MVTSISTYIHVILIMFIFRATDLVSFCDKILITSASFCLQKNGGLSVPQFGAWDSKNPVPTNYSMVFTRARANRKQHKSDVRHASLGNERELLAAACQQEEPVMVSLQSTLYLLCTV